MSRRLVTVSVPLHSSFSCVLGTRPLSERFCPAFQFVFVVSASESNALTSASKSMSRRLFTVSAPLYPSFPCVLGTRPLSADTTRSNSFALSLLQLVVQFVFASCSLSRSEYQSSSTRFNFSSLLSQLFCALFSVYTVCAMVSNNNVQRPL